MNRLSMILGSLLFLALVACSGPAATTAPAVYGTTPPVAAQIQSATPTITYICNPDTSGFGVDLQRAYELRSQRSVFTRWCKRVLTGSFDHTARL